MKKIIFIFFIGIVQLFAQEQDFKYQKELTGITEEWHSIYLTDDMYAALNQNKSDIRIIKNDSLEIPFFIEQVVDKKEVTAVAFILLNQSSKNGFNYYTIQPATYETINTIRFDFNKNNFDFKLRLEASMDQKEWFVLRESRVLGIQNEHIDYTYTAVHFPLAKYKYYRVAIPKKIKIDKVYLNKTNIIKGEKSVHKHGRTILQDGNNTLIYLDLKHSVPVSELALAIENNRNYYRRVAIAYLVDSTKTPKKWIKNYKNVYSGILSSLEKNTIVFEEKHVKNVRITIYNQDNQPLLIDSTTVKGYKNRLVARFDLEKKKGNYKIMYGNKQTPTPHYDIRFFKDSIPDKLVPLITGGKVQLTKETVAKTSTDFLNNKNLIWIALIVILLLLVKFTLKMLKKPLTFEENE